MNVIFDVGLWCLNLICFYFVIDIVFVLYFSDSVFVLYISMGMIIDLYVFFFMCVKLLFRLWWKVEFFVVLLKKLVVLSY